MSEYEVHVLKTENKRLQIVCDSLKAENEKLRELLKAAYRCTNAGPSCLECRMVAGGCTLLSAMRELGIEVRHDA